MYIKKNLGTKNLFQNEKFLTKSHFWKKVRKHPEDARVHHNVLDYVRQSTRMACYWKAWRKCIEKLNKFRFP